LFGLRADAGGGGAPEAISESLDPEISSRKIPQHIANK
jgi:hypothetical protein